jgi:hypothetical protein
MTPELSPRDVLYVEGLVEGAAAETMTPQARAYEASLTALTSVVQERNRFDGEAAHERRRRKRAERDKFYAHKWILFLFVLVAVLLLALVITGGAQ